MGTLYHVTVFLQPPGNMALSEDTCSWCRLYLLCVCSIKKLLNTLFQPKIYLYTLKCKYIVTDWGCSGSVTAGGHRFHTSSKSAFFVRRKWWKCHAEQSKLRSRFLILCIESNSLQPHQVEWARSLNAPHVEHFIARERLDVSSSLWPIPD